MAWRFAVAQAGQKRDLGLEIAGNPANAGLYRRRDDFDDLKTEFGSVAKEIYRASSEKLSVLRMRLGPLDAFLEGEKEVILGWMGGPLGAVAVSKMGFSPETAAATGLALAAVAEGVHHAGQPTLSMLGEVWRAISNREERISLEHHLFALSL